MHGAARLSVYSVTFTTTRSKSFTAISSCGFNARRAEKPYLSWYTETMSQPCNHPAASNPEQLWAECEVRRLRRSGPGGQHRNKVETAVNLRHQPTGVRAEANERRSQAQNRSLALFRLRVNLALEVRLPCAPDHAPSPLWQSRCRGGALTISPVHDDFPALLAEVLDVLAALDADPKRAAGVLGCTPSQLVGLLKLDRRALILVNRWRGEHKLRCLR
jgi:hypothetical protein